MALRNSSFHLLFLCILAATTRASDAGGMPQLQAFDCSTADNYTTTDAYAANLKQLLAALPTNTVSKNGGFFNGRVGQGAATVYGLALCSVDFSRSDCKDCLTTASSSSGGLLKICPGSVNVSAILDQCLLRYSNRNFFRTAQTDIKFTAPGARVSSSITYRDNLKQRLAYLSAQAATSPARLATSSTAPYALVQCTWDLPSDKCKSCIDTLSANASDLFEVGIDGERKSYSCRVRYSNSSFTVVRLVPPTETIPTGLPNSVDTKSNKAIAGAVAGTVVVVGSSMVAVFFCVTRNHPLTIYERLKKTKGETAAAQQEEGGQANMSISTMAAQRGDEVLQAGSVLERILVGEERPRDLPLQLLKEITQDFSKETVIGGGGFGVVYKGVLKNSSVAVKSVIVTENTFDDKIFYRELDSLLKIIDHRNVVRFLGFCANTHHEVIRTGSKKNILAQKRERLLCFEYISNGSLDKHITDELRGPDWNIRYKIIVGICNGLQYLHEEMHIIHLDLKPANIMVDDFMVPKITDFGLARSDGTSLTTGRPFISRGYSAPEYVNGDRATIKCDVYSLGVIIIDLVTGRKGIPDKKSVLRRWIHRWQKSESLTPLLQAQQVTKCIKIAERCMKSEPERRPSLSEIICSLHETGDMNDGISTVGLMGPSSSDDDMLGIEPLELRFAFNNLQMISRVVELSNETRNFVAFNIDTKGSHQLQYCAQPSKGIVRPRSKRTVKITLKLVQEMTGKSMPRRAAGGELIVQSTRVDAGLTDEHITKEMFDNGEGGGKVVDEVAVKVTYEAQRQQQQAGPSVSASNSVRGTARFRACVVSIFPQLQTIARRSTQHRAHIRRYMQPDQTSTL